MSKKIDLTKPLSEFDRKYLADRGQWDMLAQALDSGADSGQEADGGSSKGSGTEENDPTSQEARESFDDDAKWVESLTVPQLQQVIAEKDDSVDLKGMKKPDLQAELLGILEDENDED